MVYNQVSIFVVEVIKRRRLEMKLSLFTFLLFVQFCKDVESVDDKLTKEWWETASFYQIYPRSFKDSNDDGVGDLNGIIDELEYIKDIGINAVWLSPIFKSPMVDFGYDISDFNNIQPEYGTMNDFHRLIAKAKLLNLKILLDFVPGYTSDEHVWFQKSINRENGFENFYIWHPGYENPKNMTHRLPPNNWLSVFRHSAWQWNEKRGEFYFHQFTVKQPDLNHRNPIVVEKMKKVMRFWLDRGAAGFRIDSVALIFERDRDVDGRIADEPVSGKTDDSDDWDYLEHIYTEDQPESIDMIYQWRQLLDVYQKENGGDARIMMTESYSPLNIVTQYFGNSTHNGSHIPFNFQMIQRLNNLSNAEDYISCIDDWFTMLPSSRASNWVIGNHDKNRIASRMGTDRIDLINMIILTLPGASITYYGEEIGMTDKWISWNDTLDPAACNSNPRIFDKFSRDPERTPFQWNDQLNAGFSNGLKTWLPVADNYKEINVKNQKSIKKTHLNVYIALQELRRSSTLKYGDVRYRAMTDYTFVIIRKLKHKPTFVSVVNIGPYNENIDLTKLDRSLPIVLEYYIVSVSSSHRVGGKVRSDSINVRQKEGFVLRTPPKDRLRSHSQTKI